MMYEPDMCESCRRELSNWRPDIYGVPGDGQQADMRGIAAQNLKRHNDTLEKLTRQMDQLLELARQGKVDTQGIVAQLDHLRQNLTPRHGLCIDRECALCRVHEEAIKEHVLVYVDWRVPGTIQKLQQARHRN
jgi:hypothetical protein